MGGSGGVESGVVGGEGVRRGNLIHENGCCGGGGGGAGGGGGGGGVVVVGGGGTSRRRRWWLYKMKLKMSL